MKGRLFRVATIAIAAIAALASAGGFQPSLAGQKSQEADKGRRLFNQYCASCHGTDAKGQGPVAPSLKVSPSDLTAIQKADGKFPFAQVQVAIDGERTERSVTAHGTSKMPVWGTILRRTSGELEKERDIYLLTRYIESIQAARK